MRSTLMRICGLSVIILLIGMEGHALAGLTVATPEIDGASISAGLAVLAGGLLMLRSRRRTK